MRTIVVTIAALLTLASTASAQDSVQLHALTYQAGLTLHLGNHSCFLPCDLEVPTGNYPLRVSYLHRAPQAGNPLALQGDTSIYVNYHSRRGLRITGMVFGVLGILHIPAGAILVTRNDSGFPTVGMSVLISGAILLAVGVLMNRRDFIDILVSRE